MPRVGRLERVGKLARAGKLGPRSFQISDPM
jgi:hypothetical protein